MSKKTEALEVILGLMPNAKFIDKNGKDVTEDVKKSHNVANNIAQRNSQDNELMKKIFPHKEIIEGESVLVFPYIEEATPLKDVPQEVVSHMEKTLDHIAGVSKKVSLTEQWKKGELEQGYYYTRYTPSVGKPFVEIELRSYLLDLAKIRDADTVEVLAPVPSYEQWQQMKAFCEEFNALNVAEENQRLKELLKNVTDECDIEKQKALLKINELSGLLKEWMHFYPIILYEHEDTLKTKDIVELYDKTREVLK